MSYKDYFFNDNLPRILYVGNLEPTVTEDLIFALFGQIGVVKGCKIIHEKTDWLSREKTLTWPENNLDLNYVEHCWKMMEDSVAAMKTSSL